MRVLHQYFRIILNPGIFLSEKPTGLSSCTLNFPPSLGRLFLNILSPAEVQALNEEAADQMRNIHTEIKSQGGGWRGPSAWELLGAPPLQNLLFSNHQIKQKAKDGQIASGTS